MENSNQSTSFTPFYKKTTFIGSCICLYVFIFSTFPLIIGRVSSSGGFGKPFGSFFSSPLVNTELTGFASIPYLADNYSIVYLVMYLIPFSALMLILAPFVRVFDRNTFKRTLILLIFVVTSCSIAILAIHVILDSSSDIIGSGYYIITVVSIFMAFEKQIKTKIVNLQRKD